MIDPRDELLTDDLPVAPTGNPESPCRVCGGDPLEHSHGDRCVPVRAVIGFGR